VDDFKNYEQLKNKKNAADAFCHKTVTGKGTLRTKNKC